MDENILQFLGIVDHVEVGDLCIITPWYEKDAVSYLDSSENHSHLPKLVCSLWNPAQSFP